MLVLLLTRQFRAARALFSVKRKTKAQTDLFKDAPEHLKEFHRQACKGMRQQKRAEYARQKGLK